VPRGHPPDPRAPRGRGAARPLREPGPHGRGHRVRARGPPSPPEAQQGPRRRTVHVPRLGGCPSNHAGCGERSGGCERRARSSLLRRAFRHASSVVAALAALAPRLVRLAHHDYSDRLLAMLRVRYTAWDGTQEIRLEADRVFEKLSEYLSFTDDVQQAFDWLLHQGLEWEEGVRVMGLDDILELENFQRRYGELFQGPQSLAYREAVELMREMERLKRLEEELLSGNLESVDLESLGALLGSEAARNLQLLKEVMVLLVN